MNGTQIAWWEIYKWRPMGDKFRVIDERDGTLVGEIPFETGQINFPDNLPEDITSDLDLKHMLEAMEWWTSFPSDSLHHRKLILEFHLANTCPSSDYLRVYWKDDVEGWLHESWEIGKWDGFLEITPPYITSSGEIRRFDLSLPSNPILPALDWVMEDIDKVTGGKDYCLWIEFGNR